MMSFKTVKRTSSSRDSTIRRRKTFNWKILLFFLINLYKMAIQTPSLSLPDCQLVLPFET